MYSAETPIKLWHRWLITWHNLTKLYGCYYISMLCSYYIEYGGKKRAQLKKPWDILVHSPCINSPPPGQNCYHFADIFKYISINGKLCILIQISLKFVFKGPIDNNSTLVQVMAWCWTSHYPNKCWHICGTRGDELNVPSLKTWMSWDRFYWVEKRNTFSWWEFCHQTIWWVHISWKKYQLALNMLKKKLIFLPSINKEILGWVGLGMLVAGDSSWWTKWSPKLDCHCTCQHDNVMKWKHFRITGPFMRGIHQSPVDSFHKGSVMWSFDVCLHKLLHKHPRGRWIKMSWCSFDVTVMSGCLLKWWHYDIKEILITGPLWGESTGHQWIPLKMGQ